MTSASRLLRRLSAVAASAALVLSFGPAADADSWSVDRIGGKDRYEVAANAVLAEYSPDGHVDTIFVASGEVYSDALAAGPAAAAENGLLLLTRKNSLPAPTITALKKHKPRTIVVVGGKATVSSAVEKQLRSYALESVVRVDGRDRYDVAGSLSSRKEWRKQHRTVYLASGEDFPDAVAASGVASGMQLPVLLTRKGSLPASTAYHLDRLDPDRIVIVGGPAAVSEAVKRAASKYGPTVRIGGKDRYEVSVNLAADLSRTWDAMGFGPEVYAVSVTSGTAWADSLAASNEGFPILLVRPGSVPTPVRNAFARYTINYAVIVGGPASVSRGVEKTLEALTD